MDLDNGTPLVAGAGDFSLTGLEPKKATIRPTKMCRPGDFVLSIRATIGPKREAREPICLGRGVAGIRPTKKIDGRFLWHALTATNSTLTSKARGATFLQVSKADVETLAFPLPPLPEQRRIAGILDAADALRRRRRAAIETLDTLQAALFAEMFGDRTDLPATTVDDVVENPRTGPFGSQLLKSEFAAAGIPVLGIDNIVTNTFDARTDRFITAQKYEQLKRYTVQSGDVLITIMGTCGRCAVVPAGVGTMVNTKHLCCLSPRQDRVLPQFLRAAFLHDRDVRRQLGQQTKGAIMGGLNMGIIMGLRFGLPSLAEQQRFVRISLKALEQTKEATTHLAHLDALFSAFQSRAFAGDL